MTKYYTLAERRNGRWSPQFGDYDRDTVTDELDAYREDPNAAEAHRIVTTRTADIAEINEAIDKLNSAAATADAAEYLARDQARFAADDLIAIVKTRGFVIERGLRMGAALSKREASDPRTPSGLRELATADAAEYLTLADHLATFRAACTPANTTNQEPTR